MGRGDREGKNQRQTNKPAGEHERDESPEFVYLTVDEVLVIYSRLMRLENADSTTCLRDNNLLESALARPQQAAFYERADLIRQAATLLWGLVKNHPFVDANKRLANLAVTVFLEVNHYHLDATEDEEFLLMLAVANGEMDVDAVESWIRGHAVAQDL